MPGLERLTQLNLHTRAVKSPYLGKRNSQMRRKPLARSAKPAAACSAMTSEKSSAMKCGSRSDRASRCPSAQTRRRVRCLPEARHERAQEQLLRQAHALVRRHLEGAQLEKPQPSGRTVRELELVDAELRTMRIAGHVDQEIAKQTIDEPWRTLLARCGNWRKAISSSFSESLRASSTRGACDVGQ